MSLYNIENELLAIFAEIEENEGELSPELAAKLDLTQDNLKEKLSDYVKAIRSWEGDVASVESEVKRLNANKLVKQNRIDRLKTAMLQAVTLFGMDGKSGNKVIDLPTIKLFTKTTPSAEIDDVRINLLMNELNRYVSELVDNGVLYTAQDVELQGILDSINANVKAEFEANSVEDLGLNGVKHFIPFTLSDLTNLTIEINNTRSVYDFFRDGRESLISLAKNPFTTKIVAKTSKTDWKKGIEVVDIMNNNVDGENCPDLVSYPSVAKIVKGVSLQMR